MSDLTNYQTVNQYESQISGELSSGTTAPFSLEVEDAPAVTLDAGQSIYFVIDPGTSKEEGIRVSAISGTTLTVAARGLPKYNGGAATTTTHSGGAKIIVTNNWQVFDDIVTAVNSKAGNAEDETISGDWVFSKSIKVPVFADDTARDVAIASPANGMECYRTDTGKFEDYTAGSWVERESGGTFSNASTTVAGKVEAATTSESAAGTDTGGTGALLFAAPSDIVAQIAAVGNPPGVIMPYAGATAPAGWLLCDGTTGKDSVADTTLAALYAVIGTTFGGTGADDFDLPDMRGRMPLGKDNMGDSSADVVTNAAADSIGGTEGEETHQLTIAELAAHTHTFYSDAGASSGAAISVDATATAGGAVSSSTGSDTAHNNMPPYMTFNYIIKK